MPPFADIADCYSGSPGQLLRLSNNALDFSESPANSVQTPAFSLGYLALRETFEEVVFRNGHLMPGKSVAVSQTGNIPPVQESGADPMYSSGNAGFTDAEKPGHLPEAVSLLEVHLHHDFRSALEQIQPAEQKIHLPSVPVSRRQHHI
jgi:hypothetical protein